LKAAKTSHSLLLPVADGAPAGWLLLLAQSADSTRHPWMANWTSPLTGWEYLAGELHAEGGAGELTEGGLSLHYGRPTFPQSTFLSTAACSFSKYLIQAAEADVPCTLPSLLQ
jgi:hypothetical protein